MMKPFKVAMTFFFFGTYAPNLCHAEETQVNLFRLANLANNDDFIPDESSKL